MHISRLLNFSMLLYGIGAAVSLFAGEPASGIENCSIHIAADKADGIYRKDEPICFTITLQKDHQPLPATKLQYRFSENGNWGEMAEGSAVTPVTVTTSLNKPGWFTIQFFAIGRTAGS